MIRAWTHPGLPRRPAPRGTGAFSFDSTDAVRFKSVPLVSSEKSGKRSARSSSFKSESETPVEENELKRKKVTPSLSAGGSG